MDILKGVGMIELGRMIEVVGIDEFGSICVLL